MSRRILEGQGDVRAVSIPSNERRRVGARNGIEVCKQRRHRRCSGLQEAVTANAAMPLLAGEDVWTPPGVFRIVVGMGRFKSCKRARAAIHVLAGHLTDVGASAIE